MTTVIKCIGLHGGSFAIQNGKEACDSEIFILLTWLC
jgi:hypothetical protein